MLRNSSASCLGVDQLCGQTTLEFAAFYFVIAGRNPGWNVTVHLSLITMEGDKLTVTY